MIPYFQTTTYTTAASALLSVLHSFDANFSLDQQNEFDIWHNCVTLPTRGCSIYALAVYAQKRGVPVRIIVEDKNYSFPDYRFYRYTKDDIYHASVSDKVYYAQVKKHVEERVISFNEVESLVKGGDFLVLRLNTKPIRNDLRNTSNYVVVCGYTNGYFEIVDPALGALSIPSVVMQEAFESLGTKKYRDHRMLVFSRSEKF